MSIIIGVIAAVIIAGLGYFALGFIGQLCILALDTIARGFGLDNPVLGWILVGVVFGAIAGLRYGFRRAGAPIGKARSALMFAIPVIVLGSIGAARSSPPSRLQHESTRFAPIRQAAHVADNREAVTISTDGMNLRSQPTTHSAVVATIYANSPLTVIDASQDWSHVTDRSASPRYSGWLKTKYLHPLTNSVHPGASQTSLGGPAKVAHVPVTTSTDTTSDSSSISTNDCHHAEGIACTVVPEESQKPIQDAFNASLEAINQRDVVQARASIARAGQFLDPWLQRSPSDPWVARTRRHLDTISSDIQTVCNAASNKGEQLPGCSPR